MEFNILTLFPEMFETLKYSIIGKAIENGIIKLNIIDIRDFSRDKHKKVDDFIGNYISLSIRGASFKLGTYISKEKPEKKSAHCGLSCEEMEVPLIIIQ